MSVRLLDHALKRQRTREDYAKAVATFVQWMVDEGFDSITNYDHFDPHVASGYYIQHLFNVHHGKKKQRAKNTVSGLIHLRPVLKYKLATAKRTLKGWENLVPAKSYPPMTWEVTIAVSLIVTMKTGSIRWVLVFLLMHDRLLRVGELLGLYREDIDFAGDTRLGSLGHATVLRLRDTKTGPNKSVSVRHASLILLLRMLLPSTPAGGLVFPFSYDQLRGHFKQALVDLGLSPTFVPHSLRHGGATELRLLGWTLETIMERGRWASSASAKRYIQAGPAVLLALQVPPLRFAWGGWPRQPWWILSSSLRGLDNFTNYHCVTYDLWVGRLEMVSLNGTLKLNFHSDS